MDTVHTLTNEVLQIRVKECGAELCSIKQLATDKEYMWNADPEIWAGHAPVLFPIIGALKDNTFCYEGKSYQLPRHGFVRNNRAVSLVDSSETHLHFQLNSSPDTLAKYPFHFEFNIIYTLHGSTLNIDHEVKNTGSGTMYFSLGAHPAFKCPLDDGEQYSDYHLELECNETACTYQIEDSGLIGPTRELILDNSNTIQLHYDVFNQGALVFKNLKSGKCTLVSAKSGKRIAVTYRGFPYLGIWAKPHANYVCIEPWMGIADPVDSDQQLENKEGILPLDAGKVFAKGYSIEII